MSSHDRDADTTHRADFGRRSLPSLLAIVRQSGKLSGANLLNAAIFFPINIVTARMLGPELLGIVGYVALWQFYGSLTKPGMASAAYREIPPLLADNRPADATAVQNVGITGEAIYLTLPIAAMCIAGWMQSDRLLRDAFLIGAVTFGLSQTRDFVTNMHWARQRFGIIARTNIVVTVVSSAFTVATIAWLGVYTPLLVPAAVAVTSLVCLAVWAPPIGFRFQVDRREAWRLLQIGIPLAFLNVFYWSFRTVDRTAVALWLPLQQLGYFAFATAIINLGIAIVGDFGNVLQPMLWAAMGPSDARSGVRVQTRRMSLAVLVVTGAGTSVAQAGFGAFVAWLVPKFGAAIGPFEILAFLLAFATAAFVPNHLLTSSFLNRQNTVAIVYGVGVGLHSGMAYGAVRAGWGLSGIAATSVITQAMTSAVLLWLAREHMFDEGEARWRFFVGVFGSLLLGAVVYLLFRVPLLSYTNESPVALVLAGRLTIAAAAWSLPVGFICFREVGVPAVAAVPAGISARHGGALGR